MTGLLTLDMVKETMGGFGPVEQVRRNRIRVITRPGQIREAVTRAKEKLSCERLITISSADNAKTLELIYHMTGLHRTVISIATELPRDAPVIATVSDLLPPAGIYERQIHDLLGISFEGHPNLKRIILNEDWPEKEYPLRKDWKPGVDTFYGGVNEDVV